MAYLASAQDTDLVDGATGITITHGFTIAAGDVVLLGVFRGTANLGAPPDYITAYACTGFTQLVFQESAGGNDRSLGILRRLCDGSEGSTFTVTATGDGSTHNMALAAIQDRGTDPSSPEDATTTYTLGSDDFTPAPPAIVTATAGAQLYVFHGAAFGAAEDSSGITPGAPSGYTLVQSVLAQNGTSSPRDVGLYVARKTAGGAGTETPGAFTHSPDDATRDYVVATVALRPDPGPPGGSTFARVMGGGFFP